MVDHAANRIPRSVPMMVYVPAPVMPGVPLWLAFGAAFAFLFSGSLVASVMMGVAGCRARLSGRAVYQRCARQLLFLGICFDLALGLAVSGLLALGVSGHVGLPGMVSEMVSRLYAFAEHALAPMPRLAAAIAALLCLGLAAAGGFALLLQILRRKRDDYGRDYYVLAARWCATWAAWGGAGLSVASGWLNWRLAESAAGALRVLPPACAGIMLACTLAWLGVARSANPLRWKSLMLAPVFGLPLWMAGMTVVAAWLGIP
jgi:hypothetical protein